MLLRQSRQQHRGGRLYLRVASSPSRLISCFSPPYHMRDSSMNLLITIASYTRKAAMRNSVDLGRYTIRVRTNDVMEKREVTQQVFGIYKAKNKRNEQ